MAYVTRKELLKKISERRNRPIITYVTPIRPNRNRRDIVPFEWQIWRQKWPLCSKHAAKTALAGALV